jgi:hypothetical protein
MDVVLWLAVRVGGDDSGDLHLEFEQVFCGVKGKQV